MVIWAYMSMKMTAVHTGPWKNLSLHSFDQCPWCHAVLAAHSPASVCSESEPRTKNFEQRQQKTRGSEKIAKVRLPSLSACANGPVASHKTSKTMQKTLSSVQYWSSFPIPWQPMINSKKQQNKEWWMIAASHRKKSYHQHFRLHHLKWTSHFVSLVTPPEN